MIFFYLSAEVSTQPAFLRLVRKKKKQSEFYGKEFALFSDDDQPHSLKAVLEARPDR